MSEEKRKKLVQRLERGGYIESPEIAEAFMKVPREKFVPSSLEGSAYADRPLSIGQGQTISAPSMIAIMLEALKPKQGHKVLEIGAGSGYNAALLGEIAGEEGDVYTIERLESIAETGRKNLENTGYERVKVIIGDGTEGYQEESPWDRILVTACAKEVPEPLVDQLKIGGKLSVPVGKHYMSQTLLTIKKTSDKETETHRNGGCAFVPLVGKYGWDEEKVR